MLCAYIHFLAEREKGKRFNGRNASGINLCCMMRPQRLREVPRGPHMRLKNITNINKRYTRPPGCVLYNPPFERHDAHRTFFRAYVVKTRNFVSNFEYFFLIFSLFVLGSPICTVGRLSLALRFPHFGGLFQLTFFRSFLLANLWLSFISPDFFAVVVCPLRSLQ